MLSELYDRIGASYTATRRADPRIAAAIEAALGDARTVVNVGAGTGAYEPRDREVIAVEPSAVMRAQRLPGAAPAIEAHAEALPFADGSFDAAMAILSDHHWSDRCAGLRELRRVARLRAVVFTWDPARVAESWLVGDYLPSFRSLLRTPEGQREGPELERYFRELAACLGATRIEPVPIAHDCQDGFLHAFWRRPHAYLDPVVRANISVFAQLPAAEVQAGVDALHRDLETGRWHKRNAELLDLEELDLGYRLLVAEKGEARPGQHRPAGLIP